MADFEKLDLLQEFNSLLLKSEGQGADLADGPKAIISAGSYLDEFFTKGSVDPYVHWDAELVTRDLFETGAKRKKLPLLFGGAVAERHTGKEISYNADAAAVYNSDAIMLSFETANGETLKLDFPHQSETVKIIYRPGKDAAETSYDVSFKGMGIERGAARVLHFIADENDFGIYSKVLGDIRERVLRGPFGDSYTHTPT